MGAPHASHGAQALRSTKIKAAEFALSVPITAVVVWVCWFGCMKSYFDPGIVVEEAAFYEGSKAPPPPVATKVVAQEAEKGAPDVGSAPVASDSPQADHSHGVEQAALRFMDKNSTRKRLGYMLSDMNMRGPAVEVGTNAAKGSFPEVLLSTWATPKYYIVDPKGTREELPSGLREYQTAGRLEVVAEYVEDAVSRFPNGHFSFIYINPTSSSRGLKKHLEDWFPKLVDGGVFAGKDYCASKGEKSADSGELADRPWCGTYHSGSKRGKEKAGFGKFTVRAVDSFAREVGRKPFFTLEGRLREDPYYSDGLANPSWFFFK